MLDQIPDIIQKILASKNLHESKEIQRFLNPKLTQLPHPLGMKGMPEAVATIRKAMEQGTDVIIWGDYDVDGTTATALLVNFFRELGIEPHWHVPNRLIDGYGLNAIRFKEIYESLRLDDFLLITVDCGISNFSEITAIRELGGQVIVTDHHQLPLGKLPDCVILNPNQDDCSFANERLAGVGVAFYLAAALRSELEENGFFQGTTKKPNLKDFLGFVALGTISDMVELTETNRVLVRAGMESLLAPAICGLDALMEGAGLKGFQLTSEDINFSIGPRINAAGRLGVAGTAVDLMTCDNRPSGLAYSRKLETFNDKRKAICSEILESALRQVQLVNTSDGSSLVVVGDFHAGVIGIVASKIVDIHNKPTIVFAREVQDEKLTLLKGSGRSIQGVDLLKCLHGCSAHIDKYGGHAMAAGLTIAESKLGQFTSHFEKQVHLECIKIIHSKIKHSLSIECKVDEIMNVQALEYMQKLEPFGPENERPVFIDTSASIVSCKTIGGNGEHLQLTIRGKFANYRGVGFGLGDKYGEVKQNPERRITFTPMMNRFRGSTDWQLRVVDI